MYEKNMKEEFIEEYRRSRIIAKASLTGLFNKTEAFELARGRTAAGSAKRKYSICTCSSIRAMCARSSIVTRY